MLRFASAMVGIMLLAGVGRGGDEQTVAERLIARQPAGDGLLAPTADQQKTEKPAKKSVRTIGIWTMDVETGKVRELVESVPGFPIINSPEISPDGKWVAVDGWKADEDLHDARVLLVNLENGAVVNLGKGCMPTWSADGRWIAFCKYAPEQGVYIRSIDGDAEELIDRNGWGIRWAPNGLKAAYTRGGTFVIYDFIADTREEITTVDEWPYSYVYWNSKWSSDSNQICFLGRRNDSRIEIGILDLTASKPRLRIRGDGEMYNPDIAWHPDGSPVALTSKGGREKGPAQIYIFDPTGYKPPTPLEGQPADQNNGGMCWSRDGQTLIFLSRE